MHWWMFLIVTILVFILGIVLAVLKRRNAKCACETKIKQPVEPENMITNIENSVIKIILHLQFDGKIIEKREVPVNGSIIVGRSDMCDVYIDNSAISRQHFVIEHDGESFYVRDLDTTNGTLLNGVKLTHKRRLEESDKISIGCLDIVVRW